MRKIYTIGLVVGLGWVLAIAGCTKKSTEQASLSGTGFDSLPNAPTEEVAQLPQSTATQQTAIEVLPIETTPVTQGVGAIPSVTQVTTTTTVEEVRGSGREQEIQTALKNAGLYSGAIDGKIGPATKRAIMAFQTAHNLKADGKVGPKTWSALEPFLTNSQSVDAVTTTQTTNAD